MKKVLFFHSLCIILEQKITDHQNTFDCFRRTTFFFSFFLDNFSFPPLSISAWYVRGKLLHAYAQRTFFDFQNGLPGISDRIKGDNPGELVRASLKLYFGIAFILNLDKVETNPKSGLSKGVAKVCDQCVWGGGALVVFIELIEYYTLSICSSLVSMYWKPTQKSCRKLFLLASGQETVRQPYLFCFNSLYSIILNWFHP